MNCAPEQSQKIDLRDRARELVRSVVAGLALAKTDALSSAVAASASLAVWLRDPPSQFAANAKSRPSARRRGSPS